MVTIAPGEEGMRAYGRDVGGMRSVSESRERERTEGREGFGGEEKVRW